MAIRHTCQFFLKQKQIILYYNSCTFSMQIHIIWLSSKIVISKLNTWAWQCISSWLFSKICSWILLYVYILMKTPSNKQTLKNIKHNWRKCLGIHVLHPVSVQCWLNSDPEAPSLHLLAVAELFHPPCYPRKQQITSPWKCQSMNASHTSNHLFEGSTLNL